MTTGTPSCNTLAVMTISAMPPGEVLKTSVAWDNTAAKPAHNTIITPLTSATEPSQPGRADSVTPDSVSAMATSNAP